MSYQTHSDALYRSRGGLIAGVCKGIAERFDISVFWTRAAFVGMTVLFWFWPMVILYIIAALLLKKEPYRYYYS